MTLNTLKTVFFIDHVTLFLNRAKQNGAGLDAHVLNGFQFRSNLFIDIPGRPQLVYRQVRETTLTITSQGPLPVEESVISSAECSR